VFEKLQDHKGTLYNCLFVQRRWHDPALSRLWYHFEFSLTSERQLTKLNRLITDNHLKDGHHPVRSHNANFSLVRSLFLSVNLRGERVSTTRRCDAINNALGKFILVLTECTEIRFLRLDLQSFVPMNAHLDLWQHFELYNSLIYDLVRIASQRNLDTLFLDVTQDRWQRQESSSAGVQFYLETLRSQITRLQLCETASTASSWLTPLSRLRRIEFENMETSGPDALMKFWDAISLVPLEELAIFGVDFPRSRTFERWGALRTIRLNRFGDIHGAVSTILRSFPNLQNAAFHNPLRDSSHYEPLPVTDIVCSGLRKIVFIHCRAQKNLLSRVANACPLLQSCMPPDNASDEDIITLIDRCPNLTSLIIDGCTELTSTSIHYIPRAEQLRSLLFNVQHLVGLDEECILSPTNNCPNFSHGFRVATLDSKNERIRRGMVRSRGHRIRSFNGVLDRDLMSEGPVHGIQFGI
jgi:hypothetical protein